MKPVGVGRHLPAGTNLPPSPCPLTSPPGSAGCTSFLAQSPLATTIHEGETRPGQQRKFPEATPCLNGRGRPSTLQGGSSASCPPPSPLPSLGASPAAENTRGRPGFKSPRPRPEPPSEMGLSRGERPSRQAGAPRGPRHLSAVWGLQALGKPLFQHPLFY